MIVFFAVSALISCGDDAGFNSTVDAGAQDPASGSAPIDASASEAGTGAATAPSGMVVVHSDYQSTAVSFLDRDGKLLKDGCFNSDTGGSGLSMALSGDVALPTQPTLGGPVVLIDRGNAALTWLDPVTCARLRQLSVGTGFASNPHDVVAVSATKAYVTRYDENAKATTAPGDFDDGNDLLIIDPSQPKVLGRIDLAPFAPAGVLPRADRALLARGKVFVSLNGIDARYAAYGIGRLAVIDPATDQVEATLDLPGTKNCGAMTYSEADHKLLVACDGAYSDGAGQAATSAIVAIDLSASPPAVVAQVAAANGVPFSNSTVAALDGNTVLAVVMGDFSNVPPDRLWSMPLSGGQPVNVFDSTDGFALGGLLVDAAKGRFIVADGTTTKPGALRVFGYTGGGYTIIDTITSNPSQRLPPRGLAWY